MNNTLADSFDKILAINKEFHRGTKSEKERNVAINKTRLILEKLFNIDKINYE